MAIVLPFGRRDISQRRRIQTRVRSPNSRAVFNSGGTAIGVARAPVVPTGLADGFGAYRVAYRAFKTMAWIHPKKLGPPVLAHVGEVRLRARRITAENLASQESEKCVRTLSIKIFLDGTGSMEIQRVVSTGFSSGILIENSSNRLYLEFTISDDPAARTLPFVASDQSARRSSNTANSGRAPRRSGKRAVPNPRLT